MTVYRVIFAAVLIFFCSLSVQAGVTDYSAYWKFDWNNSDSSANSYNFTTGAGFATGNGITGDAAGFQHVNVTTDTRSIEINSAPLIRDAGSQFSISMWIRPRDIDAGLSVQAALFDYWGSTSDNRSITILLAMWNGRIDVMLSGNGQTAEQFSSSVYADADDTWYHVALVVDLDGNSGTVDDAYLYVTPITAGSVNSAVVAGLTISSVHSYSGPGGVCKLAIGSSGEDFSVQQYYRTSLSSSDGWIDELVFYNSALTASQIGDIFKLGKDGLNIDDWVPDTGCDETWATGNGMEADLNRDCYVDLADFGIVIYNWLGCNDPADANCVF